MTEKEVKISPADSADDKPQGFREGLYVLINKKARTVVDLNGGNTASGAAVEGWSREVNEKIDRQLWIIKRSESEGSYGVMSYRGATFLDLVAGKADAKSRVAAYNHAGKGESRLNQEWRILDEIRGYHTIQSVRTRTFLEVADGESRNAALITCSPAAANNEHQLWELERASITSREIRDIIGSWKPELLNRLVQPYGDEVEYFVLPHKLRTTIWEGTKLLRQPIRTGTFDYDDFVIKMKDAANTWARDQLLKDGYSVLFGIIYGEARRGPKAYNWYLSPDLRSLVFFDAQTNREWTTGRLDECGFEPTFAVL